MSRSSLNDYLSFMAEYAADDSGTDRPRLVAEWKAAVARMEQLRESEPDFADQQYPSKLPSALKPLVAQVEADPVFRRAFSDADYQFAMVDLGRVVVSQKLVCIAHLRRLQDRLERKPSAEQLFRFCMPFDRPPPEHRSSRIGADEFAFVSQSNDIRFLEAVMLRPVQVTGYQATGPVAGIIAMVVGYGSNYLNVLEIDGRLVLNNGHHRACGRWEYAKGLASCRRSPTRMKSKCTPHVPFNGTQRSISPIRVRRCWAITSTRSSPAGLMWR